MIIETDRLILRPFTENDAADAFEYLHEPMVHCFACMKTETMEEARKLIHIIVTDFEAGQVLEGKVVSIKEFGAFLEFAPGKEGMVHISKLAKERVNHVEDVLTLGDVVKVVCLGKDKMGRFSFSMKDVAK